MQRLDIVFPLCEESQRAWSLMRRQAASHALWLQKFRAN